MLREEILGHPNLLLLALSCVRRSDTPLVLHAMQACTCLTLAWQPGVPWPSHIPPRALAHRPEHLALGILTLWVPTLNQRVQERMVRNESFGVNSLSPTLKDTADIPNPITLLHPEA